jgi:hypothetical protein
MVYGVEAVLPSDVRFTAPRVIAYTEKASNSALAQDMYAFDEACDVALARTVIYQQNLRIYNSRFICGTSFVEGELVLKQKGHHKLESQWEGLYIIQEVIWGGSYHLRDLDKGGVYKNPWNVTLLRKFYA